MLKNIKPATGDIHVCKTGITKDAVHWEGEDDNIVLEPIRIKRQTRQIIGINKPHKNILYDNLIKNVPLVYNDTIQKDPSQFNFSNGINTKILHDNNKLPLLLKRKLVEEEYKQQSDQFRKEYTDMYRESMDKDPSRFYKYFS